MKYEQSHVQICFSLQSVVITNGKQILQVCRAAYHRRQ